MKVLKKAISAALSLVMCASMVAPAFAAVEWDISQGHVYVGTNDAGETVSWQSTDRNGASDQAAERQIGSDITISQTGNKSTDYTVTVLGGVKGADITLDNVNIKADQFYMDSAGAAFNIESGSDVNVTLKGDNKLVSGNNSSMAGLDVASGSSVTISGSGFLEAEGGYRAAGIGGSADSAGGNITINGGEITAIGGSGSPYRPDNKQNQAGGAGIGSGGDGSIGNITINAGKVTATGGDGSSGTQNSTTDKGGGAGIGSGGNGTAGDITITGGLLNATGGHQNGGGAGVGAGSNGTTGNITITGGQVTAQGGAGDQVNTGDSIIGNVGGGAGIGSGSSGNQGEASTVGDITIKDGGVVNATGGDGAAGIGSGSATWHNTYPDNYKESSTGDITIGEGSVVNAQGGWAGAGIGTGQGGSVSNIEIAGAVVNATGGNSAPDNVGIGLKPGPQLGDKKVGAGAGIGTGHLGTVGEINVNGQVTATANKTGAGIGTGQGGKVDKIEVSGGVVNATGGQNGAGIGAGYKSTVGEIEISGNGDVTATGGTQGAGIGSTWSGTVDKITISGGRNVTANGGTNAAGVGSGYQGTATNVIINGGKNVIANGGDYAAGIGSGRGGTTTQITISGGNVNATGGKWSAGIGAGYQGSTLNKIEINGDDTTVTANGGYYGAGIGSSYYYGNVNEIAISGGSVTAYGGDYAAAIGAAYSGKFTAIKITGGDIVAQSGVYSSAIGNGCDSASGIASGGTIVIKGVNSLTALGDFCFAIDTRSDTTGVDQAVLNGRFLEQIGAADSNGLNKAAAVEFVIVDANGKEIKRFTLKPQAEGNIYDSFAVNLPEGGKYYVFCEGDYDNSIVGYEPSHVDNGGKQVAYVIAENDMLDADLMQFPSFGVNYSFVSGTQGKELPDSITAPTNESGKKMTLAQLNQLITSDKTYSDVKADGGTWHFDGWGNGQNAIDDNGVLTDVGLVGTWTFTPDQTPPPSQPDQPIQRPEPTPDTTPDPDTTEIDDPDVPLASALGLNDTDHMAYIIGHDDLVRPLDNITRAEVATIFFRLMTDVYRTINWSTTNDFSDVNVGDWFNNAVSTCVNAGIMDGYADGTFRPDATMTRAEFIELVASFLDETYTGEGIEDFVDTVGHRAAEDIRRCVEAGWITTEEETFRPDEAITRADVMTIVNRMLHRTPDEDHMLPDMKTWPDNPKGTEYYEAVQEATNEHEYVRNGEEDIETWTELLEIRDWAALQEQWAEEMTEG